MSTEAMREKGSSRVRFPQVALHHGPGGEEGMVALLDTVLDWNCHKIEFVVRHKSKFSKSPATCWINAQSKKKDNFKSNIFCLKCLAQPPRFCCKFELYSNLSDIPV